MTNTHTHVRRARVAFATALMAAAAFGFARSTAHAQTPRALETIDTLIARSRFREAATALDRWERDNAAKATDADRAVALLLRARMTTDGDSARSVYTSLSLGYPSSPEAAIALFRLGQHAVASNDNARAASYFQRIILDYADSPMHPEAVTWLAKVRTTGTPPRASNGASTAAPTKPAFALQVGAFREKSTAQTVVRRLTSQGFQARVVTVPGSALARVRVGRYATARAADEDLRRLRAAGQEAVVVDDARTEIGG